MNRLSFLILSLLLAAGNADAASQQEQVHMMGSMVMPFDLSKTTHVFRMTQTGGVESVIAKDANDTAQVQLIRQHLQHEAMAFATGDYTDPAMLHGVTMPGLSALSAHFREVSVTYAEVPLGAEITFKAGDFRLATEVHRWFGAQLSEHGADARAE